MRVIGIGPSPAGDEGVGLAVVEYLRDRGVPEGLELFQVPTPDAVMPLLETPATVVLVDALLAPPGEVLELTPEELALMGASRVSGHGLCVTQAVALARLLAPETVSPSIRIVAVGIPRPSPPAVGLSPEVAAAVPRAAESVLRQTWVASPRSTHPA